MAVIISDSRNPAYNGSLSATNGWWGVESFNLAGRNTTALSLATTRTISLSFANSGNLRGISVPLAMAYSYPNRIRGTVVLTFKNAGSAVAVSSLNKDQIVGNAPLDSADSSFYMPTFEFNTFVSSTTGLYTVEVAQSGTGTDSWIIATSNGTAPTYVAWCDNQRTALSGSDTLVIKDKININSNFATKAVLGTGDTTNGCSVLLMKSSDVSSPDNICNFVWENPSASYTLTIDGVILTTADSGFRIGTSTNPVPNTKKAEIVFSTTPSVGTARGVLPIRYSNANCGRSSIICYGEVPQNRMLRVASNANTGQANVVLSGVPTTWLTGDRIFFPKTANSSLSFTAYTVSSATSSTVTMTANINPQIIQGSPAINFERYGIRFNGNLSFVTMNWSVANNVKFIGTSFEYVGLQLGDNGTDQNPVGITPSTSQWLIEDCFHYRPSQGSLVTTTLIPGNGFKINRLYTYGVFLTNGVAFTYGRGSAGGPWENSGILEFTNNIGGGAQSGASGCVIGGTGTKIEGNEFYTSSGNSTTGQASIRLLGFIAGTFKNNYFWRQNNTISLETVFNIVDWSGNIYDFVSWTCYDLTYAINVNPKYETYGQVGTIANVANLRASSYTDFQIENPVGSVIVETTNQTNIVANNNGSVRVVNENQVANVDKVWNKNGFIIRTGTGLGDTTRKTGNYALRFQSNTNLDSLSWSKNQPTGNIQGKSMTVGIWTKINSSNYWLSGNTMPRLTVIYDNGTVTYGQATQTTEWQWVQASFIPITTYGQITVILSTQTQATSTNAYVYFADFSGPLPQGSQVNLGEFNLWADAFPITPLSFSTLVNANDVWAANLTSFGSNTAANKLQNTSTTTQVGQLLADALNR